MKGLRKREWCYAKCLQAIETWIEEIRRRKAVTNEGPRSAVDLAAGGLVVTINRATVWSSAGHVCLAAIAAHPVSITTASACGDRIGLVVGIRKSYHEPLGGPLVIMGMLCILSVVPPRVMYCCC
jgi:hypothetical protein